MGELGAYAASLAYTLILVLPCVDYGTMPVQQTAAWDSTPPNEAYMLSNGDSPFGIAQPVVAVDLTMNRVPFPCMHIVVCIPQSVIVCHWQQCLHSSCWIAAQVLSHLIASYFQISFIGCVLLVTAAEYCIIL